MFEKKLGHNKGPPWVECQPKKISIRSIVVEKRERKITLK